MNIKCVESARQKDITDVMSFQLHVDICIKYILNHLSLLELKLYINMQLKWHYISNVFLPSWLDTFYVLNQKTKSKTAEEFAFYIKKKYGFTDKICIVSVIMMS